MRLLWWENSIYRCNFQNVWLHVQKRKLALLYFWSISWLLKIESTLTKRRIWNRALNIIALPMIWQKSCCEIVQWRVSCAPALWPHTNLLPFLGLWENERLVQDVLSDKMIQTIKLNTYVICSNIRGYWKRREKSDKKWLALFMWGLIFQPASSKAEPVLPSCDRWSFNNSTSNVAIFFVM